MDFYVYRAALWCHADGERIRKELDKKGLAPEHPKDERSYDSDDYPKGPYDSDSEESDVPDHCDAGKHCLLAEEIEGKKYGAFLGIGLTMDGVKYVEEAHAEDPESPVVNFWIEEYEAMGYDFGLEDDDEDAELAGPQEEDITISPSGPLGSQYTIAVVGGEVIADRLVEWDDVIDTIKKWMEKNQFWPSVWDIDDHGGHTLVSL